MQVTGSNILCPLDESCGVSPGVSKRSGTASKFTGSAGERTVCLLLRIFCGYCASGEVIRREESCRAVRVVWPCKATLPAGPDKDFVIHALIRSRRLFTMQTCLG